MEGIIVHEDGSLQVQGCYLEIAEFDDYEKALAKAKKIAIRTKIKALKDELKETRADHKREIGDYQSVEDTILSQIEKYKELLDQ